MNTLLEEVQKQILAKFTRWNLTHEMCDPAGEHYEDFELWLCQAVEVAYTAGASDLQKVARIQGVDYEKMVTWMTAHLLRRELDESNSL